MCKFVFVFVIIRVLRLKFENSGGGKVADGRKFQSPVSD